MSQPTSPLDFHTDENVTPDYLDILVAAKHTIATVNRGKAAANDDRRKLFAPIALAAYGR